MASSSSRREHVTIYEGIFLGQIWVNEGCWEVPESEIIKDIIAPCVYIFGWERGEGERGPRAGVG